MKKKTKAKKQKGDEILSEYDFSKGERGKFYRPFDKGYTVHVHQDDGATVVNHYTLAEGTVLLVPDVREYFSDSASVNEALRSLIQLTEKYRRENMAGKALVPVKWQRRESNEVRF